MWDSDRRIVLAHFLEDFLGGNAPIHDPNTVGFAVLGFDLFQKVAQGGFVFGSLSWHS